MNRTDASTWTLTALAVFCAVCGLLALNGLEVEAQDQALSLGAQSAAMQEIPKSYRTDSRADIMIRAAGNVLN